MGFHIISSIHDLGPLLSDLASTDIVALDTETSSLDWITCKLYTIQLYLNNSTYVVNCLQFKELSYLVGLLSAKKVVGHNIKYDIKVLLRKSGVLLDNAYDTMVAEVLTVQGVTFNKFPSLAELVYKYTGETLDKSVRKSFYELGELTELTNEQLMYAAEDVHYLFTIHDKQVEILTQQKQLQVLELEMNLVSVVAKMEDFGVLIDAKHWRELGGDSEIQVVEYESQIKDMIIERLELEKYASVLDVLKAISINVKTKRDQKAYSELNPLFAKEKIKELINIASADQMLAILHLFGVKVESTNEKVLRESKSNDPIIKTLLDFREHSKKVSSFGETFLDKIHPVSGRVHAEFNQVKADTGRFSCSNPNLQQIVRDSEYRHCFLARPGYKIVTVDYSQQELRLAGAITGEEKFIQAYKEGIDLHALSASNMFDVPISEVTKEQRQIAKSYSFAVLYGSTEYGLAYNFQMPVVKAKELLDKFYAGYPRLAAYKSVMEDIIYDRGESSTALGRKRFFEKHTFFETPKDRIKEIGRIKRQGFNAIIQGGGADVTKSALVEIFKKNPYGDKLNILMTVHDEIVCEVAEDIAKEAAEFIAKCMIDVEQPFLGPVPAAVGEPAILDYWSK